MSNSQSPHHSNDPVDNSVTEPPAEFDPTGLDVARRVAETVSRATPLPPPKTGPRRRRQTERSSKRRKSDPAPLGEVFEQVVSQRGWGTQLNVHALLGRWSALVGPHVAAHSKPETFVDGVLVIRTDATSWATQLRLMAPQLLAKLNAAVGEGSITRVEVKGPDAPSWRHGPRSVRDGRGPRDTYG